MNPTLSKTSTKQYYECHITMLGDKDTIRIPVELRHWKFSAIDGDPTLGDGIKCYATRHFNYKLPEEEVLTRLELMANYLRDTCGIEVIRRKIERVIYDDRSSTVRLGSCNGACPECHLDDLCQN